MLHKQTIILLIHIFPSQNWWVITALRWRLFPSLFVCAILGLIATYSEEIEKVLRFLYSSRFKHNSHPIPWRLSEPSSKRSPSGLPWLHQVVTFNTRRKLSSVSLPPPPHFELGVRNRPNQLCSNCAGPFLPIIAGDLGRRQAPIANFGFKITRIDCATIFSILPAPLLNYQGGGSRNSAPSIANFGFETTGINCAQLCCNFLKLYPPLLSITRGWFSELSPPSCCEFRIRNNGNQSCSNYAQLCYHSSHLCRPLSSWRNHSRSNFAELYLLSFWKLRPCP